MTAKSGNFEIGRLLQLGGEVSRIAEKLAQLSIGNQPLEIRTDAVPDGAVISPEIVKWLIRARQERARYLPHDLFADPAWDMLLDLLHAEIIYAKVTVSSLTWASGVPPTTALRWIKAMVKEGLLLRQPDPHDGRRVFISLAPHVSAGLRGYFEDIVQARLK